MLTISTYIIDVPTYDLNNQMEEAGGFTKRSNE